LLLVFDIGNTNIKIALFDGNAIVREWRIGTDIKKTGDEYLPILVALFRDEDMDLKRVNGAVLSSVVPPLTGPFVTVIRYITGKKPLVIAPEMYGILPVTVPVPAVHEIGTDLLCNALEAWCRYGKAAIVVDFGTALSFTAVAADGMISGIAIAPGMGTAVKALFMNTAQLPAVPLEIPVSSLGTSTVESIQAGVVLGYKCLVEGLVGRMKNDLAVKTDISSSDICVVATGGLNSMLQPVIQGFDVFDGQLTLYGLHRAAVFSGLQ